MSSSCLLVGMVVTGHALSCWAALDAAALCPAAHMGHRAVSIVESCAHMHSSIACSTAVCASCAHQRDGLRWIVEDLLHVAVGTISCHAYMPLGMHQQPDGYYGECAVHASIWHAVTAMDALAWASAAPALHHQNLNAS